MTDEKIQIAAPLLNWFKKYGRKNLPWQKDRDPYKIWLSEIMLQQTQVRTVIPYFERFLAHFPTTADLAAADHDQVMSFWSGLGYYARARNLHKSAQIIEQDYGGKFPKELDQLIALPGIGRSTASAILAFSTGKPHAILDGNVKRVLSRVYAITEFTGRAAVQQRLWHIAELQTPEKNVAKYTQAIMDLGATVCTRSKPLCHECPLSSQCQAFENDLQSSIPIAKPRKILPIKATQMIVVQNKDRQILLVKRPPIGIWAGLWSLPECASDQDCIKWVEKNYGLKTKKTGNIDDFRHTFSHFHLDISAVILETKGRSTRIHDDKAILWYNPMQTNMIGVAKPISTILAQFELA